MARADSYPLALFLVLLVIGPIVGLNHYFNSVYSADRANAFFSRAETAGFIEEFISYVDEGRLLIPQEGNPVWILPTAKTDFTFIQADLSSILSRAEQLASLPRDSDGYQQGIDDLRGKAVTIQQQIDSARIFLLVTPLNLALAWAWATAQILLLILFIRIKSRGIMKRFRDAVDENGGASEEF